LGTVSFPGVKNGRGVTLNPHPLLVPWSWKCRAIPLLPLLAVRPVQSPSACTRVHFTFYLYSLTTYLLKISYNILFPYLFPKSKIPFKTISTNKSSYDFIILLELCARLS